METAEVSYCVHLTLSYTLTNVSVVSSCTVSVCTRNACVLLETTTVVQWNPDFSNSQFSENPLFWKQNSFPLALLHCNFTPAFSNLPHFSNKLQFPFMLRNSVFHCTCFSSYPSPTSDVSQMSTEKVKHNYVNIICWSLL